ncbi:MAG: hypothetical protein LBE71_00960, partial [Dysgonamonadaceae bacterium]|nr:hypothetical protein [Dysgonamonadaceae bacterium]
FSCRRSKSLSLLILRIRAALVVKPAREVSPRFSRLRRASASPSAGDTPATPPSLRRSSSLQGAIAARQSRENTRHCEAKQSCTSLAFIFY